MLVLFFVTATLLGVLIYVQVMNQSVNRRAQKLSMGFLPKNGAERWASYTEPTLRANYLQTTNNYPHVNKCDPKQINLELCSEIPSNRIETNIQYAKQPLVIFP